MNDKTFLLNSFKKAAICRHFEMKVYELVSEGKIKIPVYLSAGQESISASISTITNNLKVKPMLFAQHRCHSTYLSFGGSIPKLIDELLGKKTGCTYGMGGSASIHSPEINMYGHDGHMGTQMPIGIGACFSTKKPTIVFLGDASAEEDYVLGAIGWASTKKLPILIIIEDNNLSILTEKKVRRNWSMKDVGLGFKIKSFDIDDNPLAIKKFDKFFFKEPLLLNINTNRLWWHSGAGIDSDKIEDRYNKTLSLLGKQGKEIDQNAYLKINKLWKKHLEK